MSQDQPSKVPVVGDRLSQLLAHQRDFMRLLRWEPWHLGKDTLDRGQATKDTAFALMSELHEVMGEVNWKPWKKTPKVVDEQKVKEELIDCVFFLLELLLIWGFQPSELFRMYEEKLRVNIDRQNSGY